MEGKIILIVSNCQDNLWRSLSDTGRVIPCVTGKKNVGFEAPLKAVFYHLYLYLSEIHGNKYDHWQEMRNIKSLDNVIKYNGTKTYLEANSRDHSPPSMNKEMKRTPGGLNHDFDKFKPPAEAVLQAHLKSVDGNGL